MLDKDTPPLSPEADEEMEDEEMVYIGDVDEVIEAFEAAEAAEDEAMDNEETPEKGDEICMFTGHKLSSVFCGSLTKDGKFAATGGEEDKAYVWDTASGEIVLDCTGHKDSIILSDFNYNEKYLATGDMAGLIKVWKMSDRTCVWEYAMGDATWIKWHMAVNIIIAGSVDGEIYMWKMPQGDCKVFQGYGSRAETSAIFPDGKRIAVGYEDGTIRVIQMATNSVVASISPSHGHSATITTIDCHSDNTLIISAAVDGKTILSTGNTGKIVSILQALKAEKTSTSNGEEDVGEGKEGDSDGNWVEAASFCKDPGFQVAATGTVNGEIFIWDIARQALRQKIEQYSGISKLVWKGNTSLLFTAGLDGVLRCYNARTSQCLRALTGHGADILDLCISENGERALTTSDDATARIFDITSIT